MTFKKRVAAHFPLARAIAIWIFAILFVGYNNDPEPDFVVGVLVLVFGFLAILGIALTPTTRGDT